MIRRRFLISVAYAYVCVCAVLIAGCDANGTYYRAITNVYPDTKTNDIFPVKKVLASPPVSKLPENKEFIFPNILTFQTMKGKESSSLEDLFTRTETDALVVVKNDKVVLEKYGKNSVRNSVYSVFSVSKSIVSTLIGIAIEEGKIRSVDDPVIEYIPELKNKGLDSLTIRDLLLMSSGIDYQRIEDTFFLFIPFSPDIQTFYGNDLRGIVSTLKAGKNPIGASFNYNDYYPILEGIILERATNMSVSLYTQKKIWEPMGMEFDSFWTLDSEEKGFERTLVGFKASAVDLARFGLLFLHRGNWNGKKILSERWVQEATSPNPQDSREWKVFPFWPKLGGFYKYHWWGLKNSDQSYDFMARGNLGQLIYVSPSTRTVIVRLGSEPDPNYQWPFIARSIAEAIR
ncbi:serine hydrolase domain-containing protein [Leptospira kmetyi]|uniref:serine hydrolase domain-containing protein n=1 Tax=Leptospira kmetyi TaxID=408139 RepID=UPI00108448D3|nr:serine hydrolase [Leptospira kmetyi]TGK17634.1 class C beta-lactamase-related serine hydrolase [Leptospira kmetyi]TGK28839.1 class C beta-lactamase-related serine hydrolase [Leptospira kmetyi]